MGKLTESMQGLRDAIKRQEKQLTNFVENGGFQEIQLFPNRDFSEEHQKVFQPDDELQYKLQPHLTRAESETSQTSHWSCSLEVVNSSIGDLKLVLKNQEKQVIGLITENEELKSELKTKEKELKKQKFLLKAEREAFEQYKKDFCNDVKKQKSEETQEVKPDKMSREVSKLKSELTHFKQLYTEQNHTVTRLSKLVSSLKDDNIQLKAKFFQQEKQSNKFILEMARRFDVSRKEWKFLVEKKIECLPLPPTNLAVCKIVDRNARLAHDNCMLKLEVENLRKTLFEKHAEESKLKIFKTASLCNKTPGKTGLLESKEKTLENRTDSVKSIASNNSLLARLKCVTKTSVTSILERNSGNFSTWQQVLDKSACNVTQWQCKEERSSESLQLVRTESAPQLNVRGNNAA